MRPCRKSHYWNLQNIKGKEDLDGTYWPHKAGHHREEEGKNRHQHACLAEAPEDSGKRCPVSPSSLQLIVPQKIKPGGRNPFFMSVNGFKLLLNMNMKVNHHHTSRKLGRKDLHFSSRILQDFRFIFI